MDELVRWLGEQLAEDERIARAATPGPWEQVPERVGWLASEEYWHVVDCSGTPAARENAEHVAEWGPARVLREIAAKRRRLDRHQPEERFLAPLHGEHEMFRVCVACTRSRTFASVTGAVLFPCPDLRDDASVYADRPGYREEWRP